MTTEHVMAVRNAVERLNCGDIHGYLQAFTPDCLHWLPGIPDPLDLDELRDSLAPVMEAFDGFRLHEVALFGDGARVGAHWRMTGVHVRDFLGIPPTGKSVAVDTAEIYEFDGARGLVRASWTFGDPMALFAEIGDIDGPEGMITT